MEWFLGVGIVALVVGLYYWGRRNGEAGTTPAVPPGENDPDPAACGEACDQWRLRRQERCNREKDEAAAKAATDSARAAFYSALAAAAALAAAGVGALAIPIVGPAIAAALFVAAAFAAAYADYLLGVLGSLEVNLADKAKAAQAARKAEEEALALVLSGRCADDLKSQCLAVVPC